MKLNSSWLATSILLFAIFAHLTYSKDWPKGDYRVEVYINGALDKTTDYTIE